MRKIVDVIYSDHDYRGDEVRSVGDRLNDLLEPMMDFARTLKKHWDGIVRWFKTNLTNGILEGLNSLVQAAKTRARGYRSIEYFKLMIYMVAGKMGRLPI